MQRFPQELVDTIVDDASEDLYAMKTCGLICKSWLPRSRFHLFSRVVIDADNLPELINILDTSPLPYPLLHSPTEIVLRRPASG
ncbi:hypothetical protein DFH09DRAFT_1017893 [Mycena vulgaris]|nr:hypothetical protein DFH09DRAFT_1017893 [Mycena vulgaris]